MNLTTRQQIDQAYGVLARLLPFDFVVSCVIMMMMMTTTTITSKNMNK